MMRILYKWVAILLGIIMIIGSLSGCGIVKRADAVEPMNGKDIIKDYESAVSVKELDETYSVGLNDFAFQIFSELRDGENIFISPYSISSALSMLYNGADKETREEMAELLGYNQLEGYTKEFDDTANHYMNANSKYLMDAMQTADPKVKFNVANSIWLSTDGEFNDSMETALLAPVRYYYNGDIFSVDFKEDKTLDNINAWVSDKTEGMIDPFIKEFSNKEMLRMFIANAIYFNGKWSVPFLPENTRRDNFNGKNSTRKVDMMVMNDTEFRYYSKNGIQGIEIPYGDERMVMNILIPEDTNSKTIDELYNELTVEEIESLLAQMDTLEKTEIGTLELPKFEMDYGIKVLNETLQELGMNKAFQAGEADFEQIGKDLFVSAVTHKAKIRVEEWGTEASAATGIEMETTSAMPEEKINFIVNVPFIFFIRDTQTDTILFMGEMNQLEWAK